MEATEKAPGVRIRRLLGTRSGTLILAGSAAALAAIILIAFLSQYRDSVRGGAAPATALVAQSLIPKGTAGAAVIDDSLFKVQTLSEDQLKDGALVNSSDLAGKVAVRDVYPGTQITAADFAAKADPIRGQLRGDDRAVAVPLDSAHGLLSEVRSGDHVDVLAGFNSSDGTRGTGQPVVRTLFQNVLVLSVPNDDDGGGVSSRETNIVVRVSDRQAASLAYAADNGKVWFVLRPPAGASQRAPQSIDLGSLLAGSAPVSGSDR